MKKLIAGNWKMNGTEAGAVTLVSDIASGIERKKQLLDRNDFLVCPPSVHIHVVKRRIDYGHDPVDVGGQDCASTDNGAFTGEISASMLKDMGCRYVILGHSERRIYQAETSALIAKKAERGHLNGLITIICVGEKEEERTARKEFEVVGRQLKESIPPGASAANTVIAYEPVWAIGTGKNATPEDVRAMHGFIRERLKENVADSPNLRILYGGSVKPDNASALFKVDNVDGALIGGASLKAEQFLGIAEAA